MNTTEIQLMSKKTITPKTFILVSTGAILAFVPLIIFAQSGVPIVDCGDTTACTLQDLWETFKKAYILFAQVASLIAFATFIYYLIKLAWARDKAVVKAEVKSKILWMIMVIVALWTLPVLFVAILEGIGTDDKFIDPIKQITASAMVETAYAQDIIPAPIDLSDGPAFAFRVFDFFLRWFAFPGMIALWVYSAALLVFAQGVPEKLKEARGWLWWTFVITVILLFTRVFLEALVNSIKAIT